MEIVEEKPQPRTFVKAKMEVPTIEKERQTYVLQSGAGSKRFDWTFDLCSVTLANFKYRRMSLVRDYDTLLSSDEENPAFEAVFALTPRPLNKEPAAPRQLKERYDVVPCDPTQAIAIADAAEGRSYISSGATARYGKSQTITNLIADFCTRGKRVLFVCEKRAAIDVVYARLRQVSLDDLCCVIHDSQLDKKEFVMGLRLMSDSLRKRMITKNRQSGGTRRSHLLCRTSSRWKGLIG